MRRPRPIKSAGYDNFQQETAAGVPDIIDAELDADAATLYDLVNFNLDDDNIGPTTSGVFAGKKIQYQKLNLHGQLQTGDFAPGAIDANVILAPGSITLLQLALAASIAGMQATTGVNINVPPNQETVLCEATWTSRGGLFLALGTVNGTAFTQIPGTGQAAFYLRLDPSAPGVPNGGIIQSTVQEIGIAGITGNLSFSVPLSTTLLAFNGFHPGPHRLQLTAFSNGVAGLNLATSNPIVCIWEPA